MSKRNIIVISFFYLATLVATHGNAAETGNNPFAKDRVDQAINKAVKFLTGSQFDSDSLTGAINERGHHQNLTAMTSLAIMAMAAVGHQSTDETPEGRAMKRAVDYVLRPENLHQDYYFGGDGSRMYGHGIVTLMLGEMLGMGIDDATDRLIRRRLEKATTLILASQRVNKNSRNQGGWRYTPDSGDADLSVTVWQVMALRSARNAGLDVPPEAIEAAVDYIRRCHHRDGFGYEAGGHPTYAMTAAGLLSMQVCGQHDADEVKDASDWLLKQDLNYHDGWFFYGTYYYAQGMYQRGDEHAQQARQRVENILLRHQSDDGSWQAQGGQERHVGRVYTTSMAVLSLSMKYHYLPIYQR